MYAIDPDYAALIHHAVRVWHWRRSATNLDDSFIGFSLGLAGSPLDSSRLGIRGDAFGSGLFSHVVRCTDRINTICESGLRTNTVMQTW